MSNSIDLNLRDNNPIESLSFYWIAIFKDSSKIEQFENNIEHKFKEVQEKIHELVYFNLTDRKGHLFTVDLINGMVGYNYLALPYIKLENKKKNIRLIYFRRIRITLGEKGNKISNSVIYHLGYQYNDEKDNNHQIILKIDSEGNFIIGD